MRPSFEHQGRRFYRLAITRAAEFVAPIPDRPFACLLWSHSPLRKDERADLAARLIASGCRYAVCGGSESEALHDDIDSAFIRPVMELAPEAEGRGLFVTTWHDGESAEEVAFYFVRCAIIEGVEFRDFLLLHVGGATPEHGAVDAALRRQVFAQPIR
jgi:hypothetical protein